MRTSEQIQQEITALIQKDDFRQNFKAYKAKINALEDEKKKVETITLLNAKNTEFTRIRETAAKIWDIGEILEDITTADGSPHKTKVKKYPKLQELKYARLNYQDGRITQISVGRQSFHLYKTESKYGEPTKYTRHESFEDFLKFNGIPPKNITLKQYEEKRAKVEKANAKLDKAMAEYSETAKSLEVYNLQNWGLAEQRNTHQYKYSLK